MSDTLIGTEIQPGTVPWVNSVFEQPWWLDCVAPGAWDVAEVRRGDEVVARMPYVPRRRMGLMTIVQPISWMPRPIPRPASSSVACP